MFITFIHLELYQYLYYCTFNYICNVRNRFFEILINEVYVTHVALSIILCSYQVLSFSIIIILMKYINSLFTEGKFYIFQTKNI